MNLEVWIRKYWKILVLAGIVYLLFSSTPLSRLVGLGSVGYLTGTQGLAAEFNSVYWNGVWWSESERGTPLYSVNGVPVVPSTMNFGGDMALDPDENTKGQPKLVATQQPILVEATIQPVPYTWNYKVNQTTLANGSIMDVYHQFNMFRYTCDWRANILLSGSEWESDGKYEDYPDLYTPMHGNYAGATVWLKVIPQNFVYFVDNPDRVFFAPAYVGLKEPVAWAGIDTKGSIIMNDPDISAREDMVPKASGETLQIFYQRGGGPVINDTTLLSYQGTELDPAIFRSEYWLRITLLEFKPYSWHPSPNVWDHNWKFPSAYMHFQVEVFVVGQWTVYLKVGDVPTLQPHTPVTNVMAGWFDWFNNPYNQLWTFFLLMVIVLIVVSVLNPGLWSMLAMKRRRDVT